MKSYEKIYLMCFTGNEFVITQNYQMYSNPILNYYVEEFVSKKENN